MADWYSIPLLLFIYIFIIYYSPRSEPVPCVDPNYVMNCVSSAKCISGSRPGLLIYSIQYSKKAYLNNINIYFTSVSTYIIAVEIFYFSTQPGGGGGYYFVSSFAWMVIIFYTYRVSQKSPQSKFHSKIYLSFTIEWHFTNEQTNVEKQSVISTPGIQWLNVLDWDK